MVCFYYFNPFQEERKMETVGKSRNSKKKRHGKSKAGSATRKIQV